MELTDITPNVLSSTEVPNQIFTLAPIGDIQYMNSDGFARQRFKDHLKMINDEFENVWYVGMGDYIDFMSPSNRESMKHARVYDSSRQSLDDKGRALIHELYDKILYQTSNRWIGLLKGHHYWDYSDTGTNTDQELATLLGTVYLNQCAHIEVKFMREKGWARGSVNIWAHHGVGSRKYPVSKLMDSVVPHWPEVDIYLMGHMHDSDFKPVARCVRRGDEIVSHNALAAVTGGWLKAYKEGAPTYIEEKMLAPRALGAPIIQVRPYRDGRGLFRRKIRFISEL